jgi:hypothetical protein
MITAVAAGALAQQGFVDHGVAVPLAERRGVVATRTPDGKNIALACSLDLSPRPWILVTDLDTGETTQKYMPEGTPNSPPYGSLLGSNGRFYTCEGATFLEFDLTTREFTFHAVPVTGQCYLGFTEAPGGGVYAGSCPGTHLVGFDPKTRQIKDYGRLDPVQQYLSYLAADRTGWVYGGRHNIVAFNPNTGERRQLIKEEDRKIGTASVYPGADGKVYGEFQDTHFLLFEGQTTAITQEQMGARAPVHNIGWGSVLSVFPDGRRVRAYDLEQQWLEVEAAQTKAVKKITFDYQSEGTYLRVLAGGPDGLVYGSSAHPSFACIFDPKTQKLEVKPGHQAWKSIAFQGKYVMGNEYTGGKLWLYDTARPWTGPGSTATDNPRLLTQYAPDINVPVGALAYPDGKHLLMSGEPGYGYLGGGLGIYNLETNESLLLHHQNLVPDHSVQAMAALPDGNIICGTTVSGGHGTLATAKEGVLFVLDWQTKKVIYQTVPVPGSTSVAALYVAPDGLVYGLASPATFFAFDPRARKVLQSKAFAECGGAVFGDALLPDGQGHLYTVLSQGIMRVTLRDFDVERLATPPAAITGGVAVVSGRIYFAIGSHLWSYALSP